MLSALGDWWPLSRVLSGEYSMKKLSMVAATALLLGLTVDANRTIASTVIDQSFEITTESGVGSFGGAFSDFTAAQTFTAGITGQPASRHAQADR